MRMTSNLIQSAFNDLREWFKETDRIPLLSNVKYILKLIWTSSTILLQMYLFKRNDCRDCWLAQVLGLTFDSNLDRTRLINDIKHCRIVTKTTTVSECIDPLLTRDQTMAIVSFGDPYDIYGCYIQHNPENLPQNLQIFSQRISSVIALLTYATFDNRKNTVQDLDSLFSFCSIITIYNDNSLVQKFTTRRKRYRAMLCVPSNVIIVGNQTAIELKKMQEYAY